MQGVSEQERSWQLAGQTSNDCRITLCACLVLCSGTPNLSLFVISLYMYHSCRLACMYMFIIIEPSGTDNRVPHGLLLFLGDS
eukprot:jgi/Chrzof1/10829/Cz05g13200.t1